MQIDQIILKQVGPFEDARILLPKGNKPDLADVYLLTGPNGSGKSTVLYALAGIIGCGIGPLGVDLGARRLRSQDSIAAFAVDGVHRALAWRRRTDGDCASVPDPFVEGELRLQTGSGSYEGYYSSDGATSIDRYAREAGGYDIHLPLNARPKFSWAAFAYAGMRSLVDVQLTGIQEPTFSPFEHSLSFVQTSDTNRLAQWIANQDFKRLKAKEGGRADRAEQLQKSIRDIELLVSQIIGEEFAFVTSEEDSNVRVRRNGVVTSLGLLPDGLKAIVSWIADLLMRLDRIPWIDDTPPLQRSFLLLLDEVDIHLHPAWQRKVLPIVQRMFPKAQIIASTHSPFVVASVDDATIIALKVNERGISSVESTNPSQIGVSYSAVLRSIFGIQSEFDVETERQFQEFHNAKQELFSGTSTDQQKVRQVAAELAQKSEEVGQLIAIELRQLDRQLAQRGGG